ncbi:3160_t:CDS:2, partial [Diversispora eburnea]
VTPTRIISGNLIKTYFGTEYLAEVHASLNNADQFFEDNHVMIICTTPEQLSEWVKCQYFEIDLVFTNCATSVAYYRIFHSLFDLILQLTRLSPQFKHIYDNGWECIIADLNYAQAKGGGMILNEIDKTKD